MRVILDGVFNHTSSDSPWFDRYRRFEGIGACEDVESPYRSWYYMNTRRGPCAGPAGPDTAGYLSWAGFDSLPVLLKNQPDLVEYFLSGPDSITRRWLAAGADGWRMDVSNDPSFPRAYWPTFRDAVRATNPDALTISETWQKDTALLRNIRGDRFDTTMNYRLRDAVLGLLAPQPFDAKGFADSGQPLSPSRFAARLLSVVEDYPPAALFSLMNLLGTHDTERALWTLTPGPETRAGRELDPGNLAEGKRRLRLAALIQFAVPGMPTIYYGDEVGLTGDDDPDDRRTYPWADLGGEPDLELLADYSRLASVRRDPSNGALVEGDLRVPLVNDQEGTLVLARRSASQAVLVPINASAAARTLVIPMAGLAPDGTGFSDALGEGTFRVDAGVLEVELPPMSGLLLISDASADLAAPEAPTELRVAGTAEGSVELAWRPSGDGLYNVYRSPVAGGGWVRLSEQPVAEPRFRDRPPDGERTYHYAVSALDQAGNESSHSNEVASAER